MPFKSKSQQRWMFATHPKMAREWAHETPDIKKLPEKVKKEKVSMDVIVMKAFADELSKIANAGGDLTKTVLRKAAPGLTSIPKVRPHVNPETVFGATKAGRVPASTVAGRGARVAPAAAAHAGESTAAGVRPASVPQAAPKAAIIRTAPPQGARPVGQPPAQGSNLKRNLAVGGGIAAASGMAGYMMPHRQQQPQAR